jgi:DNA helicase-2/ATP-dependent DNA helicase PcrA
MVWNDGLLGGQERAAGHTGSHARLLAGPGTGKTFVMTRRIVYLIEEVGVDPSEIIALTFTRAASQELRDRVRAEVGDENVPRISTLHSFALSKLLRNSGKLDSLPLPLRIADDWEESEIIFQDIKILLNLGRISETKELFARLSADWESLAAEDDNWNPDPRFIGAWRDHREIYGYTLRSELVYQLKRALEQIDDFDLEADVKYLLVDEYQDLNRCDLAVVREISKRGTELFAAGDDDQSIYGFRKAHPQGIRQFPDEYPNSCDLPLEICKRCDSEILRLAQFVAELDPLRIPKNIHADDGCVGGEVALLSFTNQFEEAEAIASLCKHLIENKGYSPDSVLILLRVDTRKAFSGVLVDYFNRLGVPVATDVADSGPLDEPEGRKVLAILRLLENKTDHLAWRTLIQLRKNGIGEKGTQAIFQLARNKGIRFSEALQAIIEDPSLLPRKGQAVKDEVEKINQILSQISSLFEVEEIEDTTINQAIQILVREIVENADLHVYIKLLKVRNPNHFLIYFLLQMLRLKSLNRNSNETKLTF